MKHAHMVIAGAFITLVAVVFSFIIATGICMYKSGGCTNDPQIFQEYYK